MARGSRGGRHAAVDGEYECHEVARNAQLETFFQLIEEWFDALSKQLTALTVGSQPQNYHPNPCFVEEEEDLDIEQEGYDIKEDDEYIERVCLVDWDSPPIYDDYPKNFGQGENIELDKNKVIYIRDEPITHIVDETSTFRNKKLLVHYGRILLNKN